MAEYVSEVKHSQFNNDLVYAKLSDLTSFERLRTMLSMPGAVDMVLSQLPEDQRDAEKVKKATEVLQKLEITSDSIGYPDSPVGAIVLGIVDRDEPKCVKFTLLGSPMAADLWVQMLPATDGGTRIKLTLKVDLNFMVKAMIGGKLQQGVDGLAQMLSQLPYALL